MVECLQDTYGSVFDLVKNRFISITYCLQVWKQFHLGLLWRDAIVIIIITVVISIVLESIVQ